MKILLDESLPRKLRYDFGGDHEVQSGIRAGLAKRTANYSDL